MEAPLHFSHVLHQDRSAFQVPGKSTLLHYIGHLLLCSVAKEVSLKDSMYLLQQLDKNGHKASKEKLQFSLVTVYHVGHNLSSEGIQIAPKNN